MIAPNVLHAALQIQSTRLSSVIPSGPIELVMGATTTTKIVLVVLACLSLLSWSIMFALWRTLGKAMTAAERFTRDFEATSRLEDAGALARRAAPSALPRLLLRALHFVSDARVATAADARTLHDRWRRDTPSSATLSGSQIETLHLLLDSDASDERDRIARFLPWLATIGSASPLIGLLGTVLGIIEAFLGIAAKGSGNLSAVAPGVAEALIATAAALDRRDPGDIRLQHLRQPAQSTRRSDGELQYRADRAARARRQNLTCRDARGGSAST